ncbi:MAG TPA: GSCFA domain-containing protein [Flavobacterium sp.]|nr:GSCFA domain-containing protein [Flavobacterium sp.]
MQFTTPVPIQKSNTQIDYSSRILSLGSCFAENIGEKLDYFKFRSETNPFGILFHPPALEKIISRAILKEEFTEKEIFFHNERWHSFDVHSGLSDTDKGAFLQTLNTKLLLLREHLFQSTHILITLGTSWVYRKTETGQLVANCHKVPQKEFSKELLSAEEIKQSLKRIIDSVAAVNAEASIIFTISPVRHIKDGLVENQRSKANLISAVHEIISYESGAASYFPSYEIMMDELRDYRFYAEDMLHPSQTAVDYIWEKFAEASVSGPASSLMKDIDFIQKALRHKPFNREGLEYQKFKEHCRQKITALKLKLPFIDFDFSA